LMRKGVVKVAEGVYWVGVKDWSRRFFDSLINLPEGTSYNAFLIRGEDKTALIDSVNPGFERDLEIRLGVGKLFAEKIGGLRCRSQRS